MKPKIVNQDITNAVNKWSNSFLRPFVPPNVFSKSKIIRTEDDGAKLIYIKFFYGEKIGHHTSIPFNGSFGKRLQDLNEESLWKYSLNHDNIPKNFKENGFKDGVIRTGKIHKCSQCRGHGQIRCSSCKGKIRWTEKDISGNIVEKICSCGTGKEMCKTCSGYGEMENIIELYQHFKLIQIKKSQYKGEVPQNEIKKITGQNIYKHTYEYPIEELKDMLIGGLDKHEFSVINALALTSLKLDILAELIDSDVDTTKINQQLEKLFETIPNPLKDNKHLKKEVLPIRIMVSIENAPVKQIDYEYKGKEY